MKLYVRPTDLLCLLFLYFLGGIACGSPLPGADISPAQDPSVVLQRFIKDEAKTGKAKVVIESGTYQMTDTLLLQGIKNLSIEGYNVTLLMKRPCMALKFDKCDQVTVSGITIDYDPLPFTQATITEVSSDKRSFSVKIHTGYPSFSSDMKSAPRHIFDPHTRRWKAGANLFCSPQIEASEDGRAGVVRFNTPEEKVGIGDLVAFDRRQSFPYPCVFITGCGKLNLEDITIQASPSIAICGNDNMGQTTLRRVRIAPGAKPEGATQDRLISSNADGANFAYCRQGPVIEDCDFSFMGDDSVNVHGLLLPVVRVDSPKELRVTRPNGPSAHVAMVLPGDTLRLMSPGTFAVVGRAKIASIEVLPRPGDVTPKEVASLYPNYPIHENTNLPYTVYRVVTEESLPQSAVGQWLDIPATNCPGFSVRNSWFHDHRARGLRLMGNNGIVEGNCFERIGSSAIQVGGEFQHWREAGWVETIRIAGNCLRDIGGHGDILQPKTYTPGAIVICGRPDLSLPPYFSGNRNVTVESNEIEGCPLPAFYAYAVNGLTVRNNRISGVNLSNVSDAGKENGLQVASGFIRPAIMLGPNVENAVIGENTFATPHTANK